MIDKFETLFILGSFVFQLVLITHFALRKWHFALAMRYGPLVYALGIPAAGISIVLILGGARWPFWIAGLIHLLWASFGYWVEYKLGIQWRNPIRWLVFGPYISLYLATVMSYWWPLALIYKPLWYIYATLFIISTILNLTSHKVKSHEINPLRSTSY